MSIHTTPRPTVRRAAATADGPTPANCASCAFGYWPASLTDAFTPAWDIAATRAFELDADPDALAAHAAALVPALAALDAFHAAGHPCK